MELQKKISYKTAQNRIDRLAKKYKGLRIVAYGAGSFAQEVFQKYDLSKLNIVAIADRKFEGSEASLFQNIKCIAPNKLRVYDYDLILVLNKDFQLFRELIKDILAGSKNSRIKIIPIFLNPFFKTFLNYIKNYEYISNIKKRKQYLEGIKRNIIQTAKSCGEGIKIGGEVIVTQNTVISDYFRSNGLKIRGAGKVSIGKYFHSGEECLIIAQNHNYDYGEAIPYDDTYVYKDIEIGDFVWLGSRVMILPGTKIGEGAIIQGGSVVHGEIPPYAIAGGNPAKVFKYRNIEHFEKLKAEEKFY